MERLYSKDYDGKTVYYEDYSDLRGEEYSLCLSRALERAKTLPEDALILCNITGTYMTDDVRKLGQEMNLVAKSKKFKVAMVGITGIKKLFFKAVGGGSYIAKDEPDALDYLLHR
jgi:hypothetical protein